MRKKQKWNLIGILDGVGIVDKGGNNGIFHQGNCWKEVVQGMSPKLILILLHPTH